MAKTYTEEQLNTFDKATLVQLLLMQRKRSIVGIPTIERLRSDME